MAFQSKNLSVLAYANGFTLWHYTTPDPASDLQEEGYFDAASELVRPGDMILFNADTARDISGGVIAVLIAEDVGSVSVAGLPALVVQRKPPPSLVEWCPGVGFVSKG